MTGSEHDAVNALAGGVAEDRRQAVVVADVGGVIRFWNGGIELLFGYRADEAVGQSLDLLVPAAYREPHWRGSRAMGRAGVEKPGR